MYNNNQGSSTTVLEQPKPMPSKAGSRPAVDLKRLQAVLDRFEISIAEANDLVALEDYEMVVIADDSGSMSNAAAPPSQRRLGQAAASRWDELKETLSLMVEMGACFDASGLDIFFLNRPEIKNIKSPHDSAFVKSFSSPPSGRTPLTECLQKVVQRCVGEKPTLLFILTDGEPNGGSQRFCQTVRQVLAKQITHATFKIQVMACTAEQDAVAWLNVLDKEFAQVDVTDDYYSELEEVARAGRVSKFTRGDWCLKAMLGPISKTFDTMDERLGIQRSRTRVDLAVCNGCTVS